MTEQRAPMPTPQKQEFVFDTGPVMRCGSCSFWNAVTTLDQAIALADRHEQDKHAIYELETA